MLPTILTEEPSKTSVSRDASDNFHRKSFQHDRFVRGFLQIFTKQCFQNTIVDNPRPMLGAIPRARNLHFATVSCHRHTESYARVHPAKSKCPSRHNGVPSKISKCAFNARRPRQPAPYKNHHFTTVSDVRPARSDERVAPATSKFAFHHSFGRPMSQK